MEQAHRRLSFAEELALAKEQALVAPKPLPEITTGNQIKDLILPLPAEVIGGILCRGEKGELAGGSKSFKTWTLIHQALAVAAAIPWWGFPTEPTNVIFLNLEIPAPFFEQRVRIVAHALKIPIPHRFNVWHLRNAKLASRWAFFLAELKAKCESIANPFLTSDPIYKLLGGRNENSAGDVAELLEQLDDMVEATQGANFFGHHFAKGPASTKDAIDRASGSGVFQRDPDTIFMMTPHATDAAFTIDAILRNHEPIEPFVVRWKYPLFVRDKSLDPQSLKQPRPRDQKLYSPKLIAELLGNTELSTKELRILVMEETGMAKSTFFLLLKDAESRKLIAYDGIAKIWQRITN